MEVSFSRLYFFPLLLPKAKYITAPKNGIEAIRNQITFSVGLLKFFEIISIKAQIVIKKNGKDIAIKIKELNIFF